MLKINDLVKIFNPQTVNETTALNNVSLHIKNGEFVSVIGGNGSGKSTLMNCVAGIFPPESGEIYIDDQEISRLSEYKRAKSLGRVFQDPMLGSASNMAIEENLALAFRRGEKRGLAWGISHKERSYYKELLAQLNLGLENRLAAKVGLLSGGQRQALTLLMATLKKPKLLLLDEHTAALDPKTAKMVLKLTDKFVSSDNITTMMVTHNMRDAIRYGDRLIMMSRGRIIFDIAGEDKMKLSVSDLLARFDDDEELAEVAMS